MKLSAGMGCIDEYPLYTESGADELFCGYVPESWALRYGAAAPLNRREVLYYNVQLGSKSELRILGDMIQQKGIPVSITFNSLFYSQEQYTFIDRIMRECMDLGFSSFIVADPGLLFYLHESGTAAAAALQLSGEISEQNHRMLAYFRRFGISRLIFHRHVSIPDMAEIIRRDRLAFPDAPIEYEAFFLNELCHFHGAFCNSLHCDELTHICRLPYRLGPRSWRCTPHETLSSSSPAPSRMGTQCTIPAASLDCPGSSGCGICALWRLRAAGITHLKLVSRGNYEDATAADLRFAAEARSLLETADDEAAYLRLVQQRLFPEGCSKNCYYPE